MKKTKLKKEELEKPVTIGLLLEFTEEVLMPGIEETVKKVVAEETRKIVADEIQKKTVGLEYNLKEYIDKKFSEYTTDIFKRLDKREQKENQFKTKIVDLFRRNKLATTEELAFLDGLVLNAS